LGTVKESEPAGHDEPSSVDGEVQSADTSDHEEPEEPQDVSLPGERDRADLPTEPPLIWTTPDGDGVQAEYDPAGALTELRDFHLYGRQPDTAAPPTGDWPVPALVYPHLDLSRIRYDYPVCFTPGDPDRVSRTLTEIIDDLVAEAADEGSDAGQRLKRHVYQLELEIKSLSETGHGARLSTLWERAAESLIASSPLSEEKKNTLREDLSTARRSLKIDGDTVPCSPEIPRRLFTATWSLYRRQQYESWREDLDFLIHGLQDILTTDYDRSPQSKSPEKLRASVGSQDEMDFDTMSLILSESHLGEPIAGTRRARVQSALETLLALRPLFQGENDQDAGLPFDVETVFDDCAAALAEYRTRMRIMVSFFKAVHTARLEISNRYRESVHDERVARLDVSHLTEEELSLCPPVLVILNGDALAKTENQALLEILGAGPPIKILVHLDDLCGRNGAAKDPSVMLGWQSRLSNMAMALGEVYVMQSPVSNLPQLQYGFLDGLRYQGPALFSVYTGVSGDHSRLPVYFQAAAASESRAFPTFTFDPGKGETQVERMHVLENPQSDRDWPADEVRYRTAGGQEVSVRLAFTLADYLACDRRLAAHFWLLPPDKWHESMIPLSDYLHLDGGDGEKIPYLTMIDNEDRLCRVVMTREVLVSVSRCRSYWRSLQESGGINNSFAMKLLSEEKQRLEEDKKREVEEIEQKYTVELDRDISGLTREIVQRIASQLIAQGAEGPGPLLGTSFAPAAPPAAGAPPTVEPPPVADETAVKEAVEEEEEEELAFDDPYIDTPLCTTCNECTNLNGQMFAYNENKQAYVADPQAGTFRELVVAAEKCPVHIIHPGKPKNQSEPNLDELIKRAAPFN
jgi:hypothetical protein